MRVTYSRRLIASFRRYAAQAYPKEAWAALFAEAYEPINFTAIYIPDDQASWSTTLGCKVPQRVWDAAHRLARKDGLVFVGDIHSHPYPSDIEHDTAPSQGDWERAGGAKIIHGICSVRRFPDGRTTTRVKFWPSDANVKERVLA